MEVVVGLTLVMVVVIVFVLISDQRLANARYERLTEDSPEVKRLGTLTFEHDNMISDALELAKSNNTRLDRLEATISDPIKATDSRL